MLGTMKQSVNYQIVVFKTFRLNLQSSSVRRVLDVSTRNLKLKLKVKRCASSLHARY